MEPRRSHRMDVERRSRLEECRLLWQLYWDTAEEEEGSGERQRRDGQASRGEEEQPGMWTNYWGGYRGQPGPPTSRGGDTDDYTAK